MLNTSVGVPKECDLSTLPQSIPIDAKNNSIRVQPSNVSSVSGTFSSGTTATTIWDGLVFPSTQIIFDIPSSGSPSQFLDHRMTSISFNAVFSCTNAGTKGTGTLFASYLRGGGHAWFDQLDIIGADGTVLESIPEYGLVVDTLIQNQMTIAQRDSISMMQGFVSNAENNIQGHYIPAFSDHALATTDTMTISYTIPIYSALLGTGATKYLNLGRANRLQLRLTTTNVIPVTGGVNAAFTAAATFKCELNNITLNLEVIDIGLASLAVLDKSTDGNAYSSGISYKVSSFQMPATSGAISLLTGIRCSSLKSAIFRFVQNAALTTANGSYNGKYDSFNPFINSFRLNVGGMTYPQQPINPLLQPAHAFYELSKAFGTWNNSLFSSCIVPNNYCVLSRSATGAASGLTSTDQDASYILCTTTVATDRIISFHLGLNTEIFSRWGLMSGINCSSAPVFVDLQTKLATTYAHSVYCISMVDMVFIHNLSTGLISVRM